MKCKNCGAEVPSGSNFCPYCRCELEKEKQDVHITNNYYGQSDGESSSKDANITCPKCGSSKIEFRREETGSTTTKSKKSDKKIYYRTVAICKGCGNTWEATEKEEVKKKHGFWWWLVVILFFPISLPILASKWFLTTDKVKLEKKIKIIIVAAFWILYLILIFALGSNKSTTDSAESTSDIISESVNETAVDETTVAELESEIESEISSNSISLENQHSESGYNDSTNQELLYGGYSFSIPSYFDQEYSEDGFDKAFCPKKSEYSATLAFTSVAASEEDFQTLGKNLDNSVPAEGTLDYSKDIEVDGTKGRSIRFHADDGAGISAVLYNPNSAKAIMIACVYDNNDASNFDYLGDFEKVLASAKFTEEISADSSSANGIRPEFKEAMDSYEKFFNEYAEFMKKYSKSSNQAGMLNDYLQYMTTYSETMEKLDKIDESELSTEETLYYTEVMNRINKKLIEAVQ